MTLHAAHIPGTPPTPGEKMTFEEFLDTTFDSDHYEWVDGEAIRLPPIENSNADTVMFLARLLADYVEAKDGGKVRVEPWLMKVSPDSNGREPDVQVILKAHLDRLTRMYTNGPADIVVEVVSVGSRTTDRRDKFREYEQGGVPEYWLIDPLLKQAEFYQLENGRYLLAQLDEKTGRFHSKTLPGFFLDAEWLWTRPPKRELLKLLGVE